MKRAAFCVILLFASLALADKPKVLEEFSGDVVGVIDGDTLTMHQGGKLVSIRLEGIDAPESSQKYGPESREALKKLVAGKAITVQKTGVEKKLILGTVFVEKTDVCQKMVQDGWAWHFKKYSTDEDLAKLEAEAKFTKRGLWKENNPSAPWDYRAERSEVAKSTPSASPLDSIPKSAPVAPAAPAAPVAEPQSPASGGGSGMVWVNGYTRKNGTVVKGYWRRK